MSAPVAARGWDRFLTDRDRDHLARSGLRKDAPFGLGAAPALLVVDVYRAALGQREHPADFRRWPLACGAEGWAAVDRIAGLVAAARRASVPVCHVRAARDLHTRWGHDDAGSPDGAEDPYEIVEEVRPLPGEVVVEKSAPSAFQGTPLLFHLNAWRVDTVLVCGEATSGCVRATVVDAATLRFKVGVVEDGCFDRTEASHWVNLFDMHQKYADVVTAEQAAAYVAACESGTQAGARASSRRAPTSER